MFYWDVQANSTRHWGAALKSKAGDNDLREGGMVGNVAQ
jgi:hypothetical protein